ncbi:hypothetical protein SFOMI_0518 [Sphingobium fuliginis]|uniref:Uncharacterized protein n=1 Tax=Sphingobium fuliginis (strain ATCC 27551) TaxID=336203 RepID=A0A292ZAL5_SPHSA|nr:hypothetical protein SFOMI_0518 [Sphingobium fuliginis]
MNRRSGSVTIGELRISSIDMGFRKNAFGENGGAIFDHGSGGIVLLRAA